MSFRVESYAGHRGEETPRALMLGGRRVEVVEVIDRWLSPDHRYFRLLGDDGVRYLVRHDIDDGEWELTVYDASPTTFLGATGEAR